MTQITKALRIADALEKCDWAGCSIGNKEILRAAVAELRALSTLPIAGEPLPAELTGPLQWAMANAFEASEADTTAGKMIDVYDAVRAALSSPGKDGGQGVEAVDWFETCLNIVHEHKKVYVVERDDLKRRGKANAHFYASLVEVCDSISQAIHDARAAAPSTQPASTALVERLGLAWAAVGHHEGIEISVHADAADTWNALCAILDPLARSALSASTSREGDSLPADHIVLEQADLTDGRVSQTVRRPNGTEYERIVDGDEAYGSEE